MPKIKDLPLDSRPREKAIAHGFDTLSEVELLAIIVGSGTAGLSALDIASILLSEYKGVVGLSNAPWLSISQTKGISDTKALTIEAAFELGRRVKKAEYDGSLEQDDPTYVFHLYKDAAIKESKECLNLLLYNRRRRLIKEKKMYIGTSSFLSVSPKEILAEALVNNASGLVVVHNHPSGSSLPSKEDIEVTGELQKSCLSLGVKLRDHIIISGGSYFSFKENKLI